MKCKYSFTGKLDSLFFGTERGILDSYLHVYDLYHIRCFKNCIRISRCVLLKKEEMTAETVTLVLVNLAGIMERADESLLPHRPDRAGFPHPIPVHCPVLLLSLSRLPRSASQSGTRHRTRCFHMGRCYFPRRLLLHFFSVIAMQVALSRALNRIGLALVAPAIQFLVADSTDYCNRGMAFGWLQLTSNAGSIIGGLFSVLIAPITFLGIPSWRVSFRIVGLSVIVGTLVYFFAKDPHFSGCSTSASNRIPSRTLCSEVKELVQEVKSALKILSFQTTVAQGVTGSFPWSALSFAPMCLSSLAAPTAKQHSL